MKKSLQTSIVWAMILFTLILSLFIYTTAKIYLLKQFIKIESNDVKDRVTRANDTILSTIWQLAEANSSGWAQWDDTGNFVDGKQPSYINENFSKASYSSLDFDFLLFTDKTNKYYWGFGLNKEKTNTSLVPQFLIDTINPHSKLLQHTSLDNKNINLQSDNNTLYMETCSPIISSAKTGPIRGCVTLVKIITPKELKEMNNKSHVTFTIVPIASIKKDQIAYSALQELTKESKTDVITTPISADSINGYKLIKDINNNPTAMLIIKSNRDLYAKGVQTVNILLLVVFIGQLCFSIFITYFIRHKVVVPIRHLIAIIEELSEGEGDLTKRVTLKSNNEFGLLANACNAFIEKIHATVAPIFNVSTQLFDESHKLQTASNDIVNETERLASRNLNLNSSIGTIHDNLNVMRQSVEQTSNRITGVNSSIDLISSSGNEIATKAEETSFAVNSVVNQIQTVTQNIVTMNGSIHSVIDQINQSAKAAANIHTSFAIIDGSIKDSIVIATEADERAHTTSELLTKLGKVVQDINKILAFVSNIADETNLLALNATIEAASAGEAGKGFAVVANEVKMLAKQTANATDQIDSQIEEIHITTKDVVESIQQITITIQNMSKITNEVQRTVRNESENAEFVSSSVSTAVAQATQVGTSSSQVESVVQEISQSAVQANFNVQKIAENNNQTALSLHNISKEVTDTCQKVNEIVDNINLIAGNMEEIVLLSNDFSTSFSDTSQRAESMNLISNSLTQLAQDLHSLVSRFKI